MKQNIGNEKNETEEIYNWRNEHGEPDFGYLQSLVADGTQEALEKLQSIAEDLNIDYDSNTSAEDLIDRIRVETEKNEDGNIINDIN